MDEKKSVKKKAANPHDKHRERMRARYIKVGLEALADHEILEMLLYYAIPRQDTNKIAHRIFNEFGSLHNVFQAAPAEIAKRCKLTMRTAVLLSMIAPLARRYHLSKWGERIVFAGTNSLGEYVKSLFIGEATECFYIICLDNRLGLICADLLEKGTLDRTELYPKEIVRCVLHHNASYVVLAHNHPSGSTKISPADVATTSHIIKLLASIEVGVLDHIVVCGEEFVSMAQKRILRLRGVESEDFDE